MEICHHKYKSLHGQCQGLWKISDKWYSDKWYSTGCADKNGTGKGAEIHFNSLEHELLDADILEHQSKI